jgi:hypothetical protein
MPLFGEVVSDDTLDVVIQPTSAGTITHLPRLRKSRGDDLADIVVQFDVTGTVDVRGVCTEQISDPDGGRCQDAFRDGERPHPEPDDTAGAGVEADANGCSAAGQDESFAGRVAVDEAADTVPDLGDMLPLINEDGGFHPTQILGIRLDQLPYFGEVQVENRFARRLPVEVFPIARAPSMEIAANEGKSSSIESSMIRLLYPSVATILPHFLISFLIRTPF